MLFRVFSDFRCKILCDSESEKEAEGGMGKEERKHLQRE